MSYIATMRPSDCLRWRSYAPPTQHPMTPSITTYKPKYGRKTSPRNRSHQHYRMRLQLHNHIRSAGPFARVPPPPPTHRFPNGPRVASFSSPPCLNPRQHCADGEPSDERQASCSRFGDLHPLPAVPSLKPRLACSNDREAVQLVGKR
jgi:hypothetical protein